MAQQDSGRDSGRTTWKDRLGSLVPALRRRTPGRQGRSRGAAELSVLVVSGSLVAGVFFGQGISSTAVEVTDGLTWLSDEPNGQILQVNPSTGQLEFKQLIGNPGHQLQITAEHNGQLYVADHTSGRLLAFDLTSILVSGQRRITGGGGVDTLYNDDGVYLVDPEQSTIAAMDPVTTDAIGTIWVARSGLADAVTDGDGVIWALEDDGTLHRLSWSEDRLAFDDDDEQQVEGSGEGSVLVAHDQGVTVFGPDNGMVAQVGTDDERRADAPRVNGDLLAPEKSPADLVPVASQASGYVTMLTPDVIVEVDMGAMGCGDPGTPEVFRGQVHVPCRGEGRVVRLGTDGERADDDIVTPGSDDPELVLDDDQLIINTPGSGQGLVVHEDGTRSTIVREDDDVPTNGLGNGPSATGGPIGGLLDDLLDLDGDDDPPPSTPPSTPPSSAPPATANPGGNPSPPAGTGTNPSGNPTTPSGNGPRCNGTGSGTGTGTGSGDDASGSPSSPPTSSGATPGPSGKGKGKKKGKKDCQGTNANPNPNPNPNPSSGVGQPVSAPSDVYAVAQSEGQVLLTWRHSGLPQADGFVVRASNGKAFPELPGTSRQALLEITPGESTTFTVTAVLGDRQAVSATSNPVTTTARPGAPEVEGTATYRGTKDQEIFVVRIDWSGAAANGETITGYDISVTGPDGVKRSQVTGATTFVEVSWSCFRATDPNCKVGGDYEATVVARSSLGSGTPGIFRGVAPPQPPPYLPAANAQLVDAASPKDAAAADDGTGSIDLRLRPPADWSRFAGDCSFTLDGGEKQKVDCAATAVTVSFANGAAIAPDDGIFQHEVRFQAANPRGEVASRGYTFTTTQTVYQPGPDPSGGGDGSGPVGPYPEQPPNCYPYTCHIP